jgi:hypothetical protein
MDINEERCFFSYQHFYVLLRTFQDLDNDHDGVLHIKDFQSYQHLALTPAMVNR